MATHFKGPVNVGGSVQGIAYIIQGTVTIDPASIAAASTGTTSVAITGAQVGDVVVMNPPDTLEAGLALGGAWVSAANTVKVRLVNPTAGAADGASLVWTYTIVRFA